MKQNPELILFVGCMFSQKSTSLLLELEKYRMQGLKILACKPIIDNRYDGHNKIVTHSGWSHDAVPIKDGTELLKLIEDSNDVPDVVAVDEAFMIPGIAKVVIWLFKHGITVLVSSIELSYNGKPFKEITPMFTWATKIQKCTAVCSVCKSKDAAYTYRKTNDNDDIVVGGQDKYEPRCFRCHPLIDERPGDYNG